MRREMKRRVARTAVRMRAAGLTKRRMAVALLAGKVVKLLIALVVVLCATGCVHEWPAPAERRTVTLHVTHNTGWTMADFDVDVRSGRGATRALTPTARYIYRVYPAGTTDVCVAEFTRWSADTDLAPFDETLELPAGDWDIYIWNDYADGDGGASLFYDAASFRAITYADPYRGCSRLKDAYRGAVSVSVPESIASEVTVEATVELQRPLTAYAFVATDVREFALLEQTRRELRAGEDDEDTRTDGAADAPVRLPDWDGYSVRVAYPGFLPSVFNLFSDKPVDSSVGVSYASSIAGLGDTEALLAYD